MFQIFFSVKDSKKVIWLLLFHKWCYFFCRPFFCEKPREGYLVTIYFSNSVVIYFLSYVL